MGPDSSLTAAVPTGRRACTARPAPPAAPWQWPPRRTPAARHRHWHPQAQAQVCSPRRLQGEPPAAGRLPPAQIQRGGAVAPSWRQPSPPSPPASPWPWPPMTA
eukprot:scaffold34815_cov63-Phaeocystis_antarctica.AAC.7